MKAIAFYLPQFHEIPENNEWWGKGYTEWTAVKGASSHYAGQIQPNEPLHDNYYNLLDKKVMEWQSEISLKAGLSGFCFYHYWFKGKLLLEKPVENYLKWTDIKQNYCISWANDSWIRTWDTMKVSGNVWKEEEDTNKCKGNDIYLIKQNYGNTKDWEAHFNYLLPFFKDDRYIRVNNRPVFIIYKPKLILKLDAMLQFWNKLACKSGLEGLYIIATNENENCGKNVSAYMMYEPSYTLKFDDSLINRIRKKIFCITGNKKLLPKVYQYDWHWNRILKRRISGKNKMYRGAFVNYDEAPRRGKKGIVYRGASPKKFYKYLYALNKQVEKDDFVFITAWNEWGEGAYLEPDKHFGFGYLKAIQKVLAEDRSM